MIRYRSVAHVRMIQPGYVDPDYWADEEKTATAFEDGSPIETGLIDARGNPIVRINEVGPIGFNRS